MSNEFQEHLNILSDLGAPKADDSYARDRENTVLDFISRVVMRELNDESVNLLNRIKNKLKIFFDELDESEIRWIFFEYGLESRGFFKIDDIDLKKTVNTWLDECVNSEKPSMNISIISGIISAISYAAFGESVKYIDINNSKRSIDSKSVKDKCKILMSETPYVANYYPKRNTEIEKINGREVRLDQGEGVEDIHAKGLVAAFTRFVSFASTDSHPDFNKSPITRATRRVFNPEDKTSYAYIAYSKKRLVGHYSANTTSTLFIVNKLLKLNEDINHRGLSEKDAKILTAMIAADYHRSGFHDPEEVYLGMLPYIEKLKHENFTKEELEKHLSDSITHYVPKDGDSFDHLTKLSMKLMALATKENVATSINEVADSINFDPNNLIPEFNPTFIFDLKNRHSSIFKSMRIYEENIEKEFEQLRDIFLKNLDLRQQNKQTICLKNFLNNIKSDVAKQLVLPILLSVNHVVHENVESDICVDDLIKEISSETNIESIKKIFETFPSKNKLILPIYVYSIARIFAAITTSTLLIVLPIIIPDTSLYIILAILFAGISLCVEATVMQSLHKNKSEKLCKEIESKQFKFFNDIKPVDNDNTSQIDCKIDV